MGLNEASGADTEDEIDEIFDTLKEDNLEESAVADSESDFVIGFDVKATIEFVFANFDPSPSEFVKLSSSLSRHPVAVIISSGTVAAEILGKMLVFVVYTTPGTPGTVMVVVCVV